VSTPKRTLFVEVVTPGARPQVVEVFEPSDELMAELGWQRIRSTPVGFGEIATAAMSEEERLP
jgi:hypothetical protein